MTPRHITYLRPRNSPLMAFMRKHSSAPLGRYNRFFALTDEEAHRTARILRRYRDFARFLLQK